MLTQVTYYLNNLVPSIHHPAEPREGMGKLRQCIFCQKSDVTFYHDEHIISESLGGGIISNGRVCDDCNNYFGTQIEQRVLDHEFGLTRAMLSLPTKKKKPTKIQEKHYNIQTMPAQNGQRRIGISIEPQNLQSDLWVVEHKGMNKFSVNRRIPHYDPSLTSAFLSKMLLETYWLLVDNGFSSDVLALSLPHATNARFHRPRRFIPYTVIPVTYFGLALTFTSTILPNGQWLFVAQVLNRIYYMALEEAGNTELAQKWSNQKEGFVFVSG